MKKSYLFLILSIACTLLLASCSPSGGSATGSSTPDPNGTSNPSSTEANTNQAYHKITPEKAKEMMDAGDAMVVDVRTVEEYVQKRIPGAVLVPNESIGNKQPEKLPDKDAVLLIYCRTGIRSRQASEKLVQLGYSQIYDFGGIVDWPYETESGNAE